MSFRCSNVYCAFVSQLDCVNFADTQRVTKKCMFHHRLISTLIFLIILLCFVLKKLEVLDTRSVRTRSIVRLKIFLINCCYFSLTNARRSTYLWVYIKKKKLYEYFCVSNYIYAYNILYTYMSYIGQVCKIVGFDTAVTRPRYTV